MLETSLSVGDRRETLVREDLLSWLPEEMDSTQSAGQIRGSFIIQHWATPPPLQHHGKVQTRHRARPLNKTLTRTEGGTLGRCPSGFH